MLNDFEYVCRALSIGSLISNLKAQAKVRTFIALSQHIKPIFHRHNNDRYENKIMDNNNWWKNAIIYQIYPRSLKDSNGDGIGDIQGIISKLDYIESLGVDAVWISPFFKSPMKDFGYDISDYRNVDPIFGSLSDFDELIDKAHARHIRVMIDQVLSHTSDEHDWFKESRENTHNAKADWYVWADAKDDGSPPNNWLSIFGGGAWQWDARRKQYYLHNFLTSQPDLNFHNTDVQQQMLSELEFWLKRGVDGVRLDAINFCFHDKQLRDNPAKPINERQGRGFRADNPYAFQWHTYNNTQPENLIFLEKLRTLVDKYPGTVTLGEVSSDNSLNTMVEYTKENTRLHTAYSFELLVDDFCTDYIRQTVETLNKNMGTGWPCWAISNHDVTRVLSRWGGDKPNRNMAKVLTAFVASLRGSVCSYQGEELGLTEVDIQQHDLQDPYGIAFWPNFKGRDGCRTPMPWLKDCQTAGFSTVKPWLPIEDGHKQAAVSEQLTCSQSVLSFYQMFMHWRKKQPALLEGNILFIDTPKHTLAFTQ